MYTQSEYVAIQMHLIKHAVVYNMKADIFVALIDLISIIIASISFNLNGTAHFEKCKQLLEYQFFLLLRHLVIKILIIFSTPMLIRHLWQHKTLVFLQRCPICIVPLVGKNY
jgi:hypothetical protein